MPFKQLPRALQPANKRRNEKRKNELLSVLKLSELNMADIGLLTANTTPTQAVPSDQSLKGFSNTTTAVTTRRKRCDSLFAVGRCSQREA
jgi:hypothetical protein